jgi:hypothetical protein
MNDKFSEQLRNILADTPPLKEPEPVDHNAHGDVEVTITFGVPAMTPQQAADARVQQYRESIRRRGAETIRDVVTADLREYRRRYDDVKPRPPFITRTVADVRRRCVRSTFGILMTEAEATADLIDRALDCGCPHCALIKLPSYNAMLRQEIDQVEYWLNWEQMGGYNR